MKVRLTILSLSILFSVELFGQTEQQLLPAEKKQQTLITQPVTLYKGFFRSGFSTEYIIANTLFNDDGERVARFNGIGSRWNLKAMVEYGITDRLQAALIIPYTTFTASASVLFETPFDGSITTIRREAKNTGLEDLEVEAAYQVFTESEKRPSIAVFLNMSLPTAEKNPTDTGNPEELEFPTGNGNFISTLTVNARKINYPFLYSGSVSYQYEFQGTKVLELGQPEQEYRDAGLVSFGGLIGYHVNEWMAIINDLTYSTTVGNLQIDGQTIATSAAWFLNYSPQFTFQIKRLRINQFLTFPIVGRNTTADPRYQLGIQYVF